MNASTDRTTTQAPATRWTISRPGVAPMVHTFATHDDLMVHLCNAAVAHAVAHRLDPIAGASITEASHEGSFTVDIIEYQLAGGWSVKAVREV